MAVVSFVSVTGRRSTGRREKRRGSTSSFSLKVYHCIYGGISKFGSFHYSEEVSVRREDTRTFQLWAWCSLPKRVPKCLWVTVSNPDPDGPEPLRLYQHIQVHRDEPEAPQWGSLFEVLVHLERVVDLERTDAHGGSVVTPLTWALGVPDDDLGGGMPLPQATPRRDARRELARHSCSVDAWPERRRNNDDDEDGDNGHNDRGLHQHRSLLQRLR